jgi:hypothetical protein
MRIARGGSPRIRSWRILVVLRVGGGADVGGIARVRAPIVERVMGLLIL